jgi:hypothetical protein
MAAYAVVVGLALGFDLLTDRSFGAFMLAVLPISLIALTCLLVGPWLRDASRLSVLKAWLAGTALVLGISITFSMLGPDQAKTGEMIFAYAAIIMALPSSLVLPLLATWLEPVLGGGVINRIIGTWIACVAAGWVQWQLLQWTYAGIRRRLSGNRAAGLRI